MIQDSTGENGEAQFLTGKTYAQSKGTITCSAARRARKVDIAASDLTQKNAFVLSDRSLDGFGPAHFLPSEANPASTGLCPVKAGTDTIARTDPTSPCSCLYDWCLAR